jgi:hypothetical protein
VEAIVARAHHENVVAHWHKLIENFETSPKDFYGTLEKSLFHRRIPGLAVSRVRWSESGLLSPDREYLRVTGDFHCYDICAAPFGTGYFFSSWLTQLMPQWLIVWVAAFVVAIDALSRILGQAYKYELFAVFRSISGNLVLMTVLNFLSSDYMMLLYGFVLLMWLVALLARAKQFAPERAMLAIPLVGALYGKLFAPQTYYRIDTMLMFQSAVHSALLEVIDRQTSDKGLRALTEVERKPIFHRLL